MTPTTSKDLSEYVCTEFKQIHWLLTFRRVTLAKTDKNRTILSRIRQSEKLRKIGWGLKAQRGALKGMISDCDWNRIAHKSKITQMT